MPDPTDQHPLAPDHETAEERRENTTQAVNVRAGVEVGPMRYVLGIGIILAVVAFVAAFLYGRMPHP